MLQMICRAIDWIDDLNTVVTQLYSHVRYLIHNAYCSYAHNTHMYDKHVIGTQIFLYIGHSNLLFLFAQY